MIIVRIRGGLGNQLFQYAAGYALAERLGQPLVVDVSFFSKQSLRNYRISKMMIEYDSFIDDFQLPLSVRILKNKYVNKFLRKVGCESLYIGNSYTYILERDYSDITSALFDVQSKDIYLDGYFQAEVYFASIKAKIYKQYIPLYEKSDAVNKILSQIEGCNAIAVHVRRGDFIEEKKKRSIYHYLLDENYYIRALKYIQDLVRNPVLFWFSDDIDWVKKNFGIKENFRFVSFKSENRDIDDMYLMSKCKHIIAANSTFSWWGAYLNTNENAIRVVPERAFGGKYMIPVGWVKL